jgi:hypothetical protein
MRFFNRYRDSLVFEMVVIRLLCGLFYVVLQGGAY